MPADQATPPQDRLPGEFSNGKTAAEEGANGPVAAPITKTESHLPELTPLSPPSGADEAHEPLKSVNDQESETAKKSPQPSDSGANESINGEQRSFVQLLLPAERLAVEIHQAPTPKGFLRTCGRLLGAFSRNYGSLLTGLVSVTATIVIAILAQQISKQQTEISEAQAKTAQEGVNVRFIEEFKNHLGDLTLPDADRDSMTKKTLAAITLSQYGERALPALKISLAVEDPNIRNGAEVVVVQMLSDRSLRPNVLKKLSEYFGEPDEALRLGVLECYVRMKNLSAEEFRTIANDITQRVTPATNCGTTWSDKPIVTQATKFFCNWPYAKAKDFLLAVARNPQCDLSRREDAINYLPRTVKEAKDLSSEERDAATKEVLSVLQDLLQQGPVDLKKNVTAAIAALSQ